jgi:hypothetical protein
MTVKSNATARQRWGSRSSVMGPVVMTTLRMINMFGDGNFSGSKNAAPQYQDTSGSPYGRSTDKQFVIRLISYILVIQDLHHS